MSLWDLWACVCRWPKLQRAVDLPSMPRRWILQVARCCRHSRQVEDFAGLTSDWAVTAVTPGPISWWCVKIPVWLNGTGLGKALYLSFCRGHIIIVNNNVFPFIVTDTFPFFQNDPLGGRTNLTRRWISSMPTLPFVSPDPCGMIVDHIIMFTDRDLFAESLCV